MDPGAGAEYRKSRVEYKRALLSAKQKSWESLCMGYAERFDGLFRITFNKCKRVNDILANPNHDPNLSIVKESMTPLSILTMTQISLLMDHFFPPNSMSDLRNNYNPTRDFIEEINLKEMDIVIKNLKNGKAPGLDQLDYKIWDAILQNVRYCYKDCTQSSFISPNFWYLHMNQLAINNSNSFIQASADDLALASAGSVRKELEDNTNNAPNEIAKKLKELKLDLLVDRRSSIDAPKGYRTKSKLVNSIKEKLRLEEGFERLPWVKAHVGIPGNKFAIASSNKQALVEK
ncbi:hypothetical protein AVEN_9863-1 [Araneus ventricosus]|uniref:RNase H type-1 domain-containing protein n=1 Tax=Araneus ventricosus TaxID=182803 RepID=A0A4Y2EG26_ARAVE|nr:hypothetical protein AVEN_9863-1 [Araneus ventricosus]